MFIKKPARAALAAILALAVTLPLAGCGGSRRGRELRMNVTAPENSAWMDAADKFRELVEKRTSGRYKIEIYPDERIAEDGAETSVENLVSGGAELGMHALTDMRVVQEKLAVAAMPFLFPDYDSVDKIIFNGEGKNIIFDLIRDMGCEPLALGENGFRQITNNIRSIESPADLPGLTFRIPRDTLLADLFDCLNAETVVTDRDAAFALLQADEINGQENSPDIIQSSGTYKIQRYMTVWNCVYDPVCLSVSGAFWEELSEPDREIFRAAAEEACTLEIAAVRERESAALEAFSNSGMEITFLTPDEREAFRVRTAPVYTRWRDIIGDDLFAAFGVVF